MRRSTFLLALLTTLIGFAGSALAADKADPNGTWKWSTSFTNNGNTQTRESVLKLKLEGDKLTGTINGRNNTEVKIEDAMIKDNEVSFSITRERDGNKSTMKYKAKIDGDVMKGTIEGPGRDGQTRTREFEAKREKV